MARKLIHRVDSPDGPVTEVQGRRVKYGQFRRWQKVEDDEGRMALMFEDIYQLTPAQVDGLDLEDVEWMAEDAANFIPADKPKK